MNLYLMMFVACCNEMIVCGAGNERELSFEDDCPYALKLSSDGPVTLDVPVTVQALLACAAPDEEYHFVFKDETKPFSAKDVQGNSSAVATFLFREEDNLPGYYPITVVAYLKLQHRLLKVASKAIRIRVTDHIPGSLSFSNTTTRLQEPGVHYIATNQTTNMTLDVVYPQRFYQDAEFTYSWQINNQQFITSTPFRSYRFQEAGTYSVHVSAVARIPVYDNSAVVTSVTKYKWGNYIDTIVAKDFFYAVNLTGNTYLQHGQLLNMDVTCNGSGPIEYCWKVLKPSENQTNVTCSIPISTNVCSFPIIYYFHTSGDYVVSLFVDNFVTSLKRNVEVHVYDVSSRPQLSTVLVPLICVILAIVIIAGAVVAHIRRRETIGVEIADFDFLQAEPFSLETFWEHMRHTLFHARGSSYCLNANLSTQYGSVDCAEMQKQQQEGS